MASSSLGRASPILAAAISFTALGFTKDSLDPSDIYAAFSVFLALRMPMILLPMAVTYLMSVFVSLNRIKTYLLLPERESQKYDPLAHPMAAVIVRNTTFQFMGGGGGGANNNGEGDQHKFTLSVEKLDIEKGSLTAIVGPVGSGKSALLSAILGDMKGSEEVVLSSFKLQLSAKLRPPI